MVIRVSQSDPLVDGERQPDHVFAVDKVHARLGKRRAVCEMMKALIAERTCAKHLSDIGLGGN